MSMDDTRLALSIQEELGTGAFSPSHSHCDPGSFVCYDNDESKELHFRFPGCVCQEWLESRIFIGGKETKAVLGLTKQVVAEKLMQMNPDTFIPLNFIAFVSSEDEMEQLCDELNQRSEFDIDDVPENIMFGEDLDSSCIGCLWHHQNTVIINVAAIQAASEEMAVCDQEMTAATEFKIGIWMTLIHELRHLMLDCNPFLPIDEYKASDAEEKSVEEFCRREYERLFVV